MAIVAPEASKMPPAIEAQRPHSATPACSALDGQCVSHEDDWGTTIHFGAEHRASAGPIADVLTHRLTKWDNDAAPTLSVGAEDLDLDGTCALIAAVEKQLASLYKVRDHQKAAGQQFTAERDAQVTA